METLAPWVEAGPVIPSQPRAFDVTPMDVAVLDLREIDGIAIVRAPQGADHTLRDVRGKPLQWSRNGWSPCSALRLPGGLSLLEFAHTSGTRGTWLLGPDFTPRGDLKRLAAAKESELLAVMAVSLAPLMRRILSGGGEQALAAPEIEALRSLAPEGRATLLEIAALGLAAGRRMVADGQMDDLAPRARCCAGALLAQGPPLFSSLMALTLAQGRLIQKSLHEEREVAFVSLIPLDGVGGKRPSFAIWCAELEHREDFILLAGSEKTNEGLIATNAAYFPSDGTFLDATQASAETTQWMVAKRLATLANLILECGPAFFSWLRKQDRRLALCTVGRKHLGHAVWDELSGLERHISLWPASRPLPAICVPTSLSGAEIYGRLETIFPECRDRIFRAERWPALLAQAVNAGDLPIFALRRRVTAGVRPRIMAAALTSLPGRVAARQSDLYVNRGERAPVLALGLRLMNRTPSDLLGFYVRLTVALVARHGNLVVIIDGLNTEGETGLLVAPIANASLQAKLSDVALTREAEFVNQLRAAVAGIPVQLVNCVGLDIQSNLVLLSGVDFFVAPMGAGLAKLRWTLDKPGLVLTSGQNLTDFARLHLYDDPRSMEPPFAPLYFTEPEEVEDLPLDNNPSASREHIGIPHPHNFRLDEARVIPRICDLFARHFAANHGAASAAPPSPP